MGKKTLKRHHKQKVYKMKGCSKRKNSNKNRTRKYLGGGLEKAYPSTDPVSLGVSVTPTNKSLITGGSCGGTCPTQPPMMGGKKKWGGCCGSCGTQMTGGGSGCGCGKLFGGKKRWGKQKGGYTTWDPQGLIGQPWTPAISGWPGVDGVAGNRNFLAFNAYKVDPQTAMKNVGANPPFLGGKRRKGSRKQKGGNLIGQDFINLGRQIEYGFGSAYNGINGYAAPINPLPWKDQLTHSRAGSLDGAIY